MIAIANVISFRVIHLSTSHKGGAGIAARRLNSELNSLGIDSIFYSIYRSDFIRAENEFFIKRGPFRLLLGFLSSKLGQLTLNTTFFSILSSPAVSNRWIRKLTHNEASIIHIHNWFNLLSFSQLKRLIATGRPIVLSMHDQRLMTGGCHIALECRQLESGCTACPKVKSILRPQIRNNSRKSEKFFSEFHPNLRVITPSHFMVDQAKVSSILRFQKLSFVPNPLPVFSPLPGIRRQIISNKLFRVGVASANPTEPLKGGDLIQGLSNHLEKKKLGIEIVYLANFKHSFYGDFWEQINCLLVPSRGDNSPNVIHEAKVLGIPVIASDVGGIPELLDPEFDIKLDHKSITPEIILESILDLKQNPPTSEAGLNMRNNYYNYVGSPLKSLVDVYEDLVLFNE